MTRSFFGFQCRPSEDTGFPLRYKIWSVIRRRNFDAGRELPLKWNSCLTKALVSPIINKSGVMKPRKDAGRTILCGGRER